MAHCLRKHEKGLARVQGAAVSAPAPRHEVVELPAASRPGDLAHRAKH